MTEKPFDEKAAWGTFATVAPIVGQLVNGKAGKGNAANQRKAMEKPPVSKNDGRRKKTTGRSAVFNTKLKPELRTKLFDLAAERDIGVAALLEQIVAEWEAAKGKQDQ